jgi:hypothetical protein
VSLHIALWLGPRVTYSAEESYRENSHRSRWRTVLGGWATLTNKAYFYFCFFRGWPTLCGFSRKGWATPGSVLSSTLVSRIEGDRRDVSSQVLAVAATARRAPSRPKRDAMNRAPTTNPQSRSLARLGMTASEAKSRQGLTYGTDANATGFYHDEGISQS